MSGEQPLLASTAWHGVGYDSFLLLLLFFGCVVWCVYNPTPPMSGR